LSAAAADIGLWKRNLDSGTFTATEKWYELLGFDPGTQITYQDYMNLICREDRERVETMLAEIADNGGEYATEYRVWTADGKERWISSIGKVEVIDGKPGVLRGVSVDISKRKLAEQAAHDLSRKLMGAQEKERARLARELHDDLSQSLALLSIQLQVLGKAPNETGAIKKHVDNLTEQIQRLSMDVHRISHELHPSKLSQLGLEAALRGFCRETAAARGMKIGFDAKNVPRDMPNDISLCLYRIAQEGIQNAVKHSGASFANITLRVNNNAVRMVVSDNGCGFDPEKVKSKEALGLVSMDERIRAVDGKLTIDSVIDSGTKIEAHVPLPPK
jgi:PAS domain S-box-containing protein